MLAIPRPRTRADCLQEARPCPWVACQHHLLLEVAPTSRAADARATTLRTNVRSSTRTLRGRRKGLPASAAELLVRTWIDDAVEQLSRMRFTCELDVVDSYPRGLSQRAVASVLGVTKRTILLLEQGVKARRHRFRRLQ